MQKEKFWKKSWDKETKDIDPKEFETTFVDLAKDAFADFPDKVALVFMGTKITFSELNTYADQFANMLLDKGFTKGDVVGINLYNIPQYVIAMLGTLRAGCIVSGVSPLLSPKQIKYQLSDLASTGKKVALVTLDSSFAECVAAMASDIENLKLIVTTGLGDFLPKAKQILGKLTKKIPTGKVTPLPGLPVLDIKKDIIGKSTKLPVFVKISSEDIGWIQYTGGTTGDPKGVMLNHRNIAYDLLAISRWVRWERGKGTLLSGFPMFHIAGLMACNIPLFLGWTQVLVPNPRDTDYICKAIGKHKPNVLANVPSLYQILMANPKFKQLDHSKLSVCLSSASPFPVESQEKLEKIIGKGKLMEVFGMTETMICIANPYNGIKKLGTIGLPVSNVDFKIVDTITGETVSPGKAGEICIKGPTVMQGYFNKPQETQKAIDKDAFFRSGDVGIMDQDGYIRIVDRTKDMIIVGGFKVFSTKVENTLSSHPAVEQVALIGLPNPDRPGSEIVKAYIQLAKEYQSIGDPESIKKEIITFAKDHCTPYEVPKIISFVGEVPLTAIGKVDKKVLRIKSTRAN